MQIVFKTKNRYCLEIAKKNIEDMEKKFKNVLDFSHTPLDIHDESRGIIVNLFGYADAQVIIGGVDGSYIKIMYLQQGETKFYDIDLSKLQRIISL